MLFFILSSRDSGPNIFVRCLQVPDLDSLTRLQGQDKKGIL